MITTSKTISFRVQEPVYDFIVTNAKDAGLSVKYYIISQLDPESDIMKFIKSETKKLDGMITDQRKEIKELEKEIRLLKAKEKSLKKEVAKKE